MNLIKRVGLKQLVNFMTFNEWLNEIEGFGLRVERIRDDLVINRDIAWHNVKEWLEAAYDAGREQGQLDG